MKLTALDPHLLIVREPGFSYERVYRLSEAHGIDFLCPACLDLADGDPLGVHRVRCWFDGRGVPVTEGPTNRRWIVTGGDSLENLSLVEAVEISVGCNWRGFIHNGEAVGA